MMYSNVKPIFYLPSYLYIIDYIVFIICLLFILLGLVYLLSTRVMVKDAEKLSSYECGFQAFGDTRATFDVQFYLVAIIFLIFDIEVAFIIPWAVMLRYMDFIGLLLMYFFLFILTVGFIYEWKSGVLSWRNTALQNIIENPKSNNWFKEYSGFIFLNLSTFTDVNVYVTSFSNYFQSSIFIWFFIAILVFYLLHIAFKHLALFKIHLNDLIIIFLSIIIVELLVNLYMSNEINIIIFNDLLISDAFTDLFLLVLNITAFFLITSINFIDDLFSEYEFVIVFALYLIFLNFMISSINLLTIYLTIEGSSFCLFILISYTTTQWSAIEAAIKYFVQSAVVGVIFALGQAFLYGIIPTLNLYDIAFILSSNLEVPKSMTNFFIEGLCTRFPCEPMLSFFDPKWFEISYTVIIKDYLIFSFIKSNFFFYLSCILILSALFFKLSVFPFHFWTADVYDGAPTTVTALMALLNKIAVFAVFIRFVIMVCYVPELHNNVISAEMSNALSIVEWNPFKFIFKFSILGSVILGGFAVLRQKTLKRFAAYSTINNIGFILIGFFAIFNFTDYIQNGFIELNSLFIFECITSMLVYFFIYNFTNLAFFLIISTSFVKNSYINKYLPVYFMSDITSLYRKNKLISLFMVIVMFIFSGLPPFVTFYSKIMILRLLMNTLSFSEEIFLFLFIILLCTVVTSYFYIRVARTIFAEVENTSNQKIVYTNLDASTIIFYIFGLILLMPFLPTIINYCFFASQSLVLFN